MFYQKCSSCHSEWNSIKMVLKCPFCNHEFDLQTDNFKSVPDVFNFIFSIHGTDVINQKGIFLSLFSDYAPTLEKERRGIRMAIESGIYADLLSVNKNDTNAQDIARAKAVSKLTNDYMMDIGWAKQLVFWLTSNLEWSSQNAEFSHPFVPADREQKSPETTANTQRNTPSGPVKTVPAKPVPPIQPVRPYPIGEKIEFGSYPYDVDGTPGNITWKILDIKDGKALLWSTMCLDAYIYNRTRRRCNWRDCSLRLWLKDRFTQTAFKYDERTLLHNVETGTSRNPRTGTTGGPATYDRVFILSNEEFDIYGLTVQDLKAFATPYAKKQGVFCASNSDSYYWVRTPGSCDETQMFIGKEGRRDEHGNFTDQKGRGIRPAIWVDYSVVQNALSHK